MQNVKLNLATKKSNTLSFGWLTTLELDHASFIVNALKAFLHEIPSLLSGKY